MTSDETAALMDFLATRFARMDAAFATIDARVAAIEAHLTQVESQDDVRRDLSGVAAGVAALKEDLDREFGDLHVRFERYEIALATARLADLARTKALEQDRRPRAPRG